MHLREGRLEDIPFIADIGTDALWDDEIIRYLAPYREQYPLSHRDNYLYRSKKRYFAGDRFIVATTEPADDCWTGKEVVVGFAFWSDTDHLLRPNPLPSSILGNGFEQLMQRLEGIYRWYFHIDRSFEKLRFAKFWKILGENPFFEEISRYLELESLAVAPDFQGRGIGSMLLQWGMSQASFYKVPLVVAATFDGERLYRKHGFEECGRLDFPDSEFTWAAMVWQPAGVDESSVKPNRALNGQIKEPR